MLTAMQTDLERFVAQDGRSEAIAEVARQIEADGITYVYFQFVSVTGRVMGKGIPAAHWTAVAIKGFQLVYGATANLFTDRHGQYIGYGPEAAELVGLPDVTPSARCRGTPRWPGSSALSSAAAKRSDDGGGFLSSDCRGNLHRQHEQFIADTGLTLRVGCEPEMMWLKTNPDGTPSVEGVTKPYCYHIDQFSELQPVIHKVIEYSTQMGLDMIQGDHEDAPGQLELNFTFGRAEDTADRLTTYRQVCRQVGREMGSSPASCPSPSWGSRPTGATTTFRCGRTSVNMFLPEGDDARMPSKTGLNAIGGVLTHLRALTAITAPTVNSYRRFADAGFWAPVFADWGFQNRTTALRVSAPGRFEYRSVDSAVNPYLSMAALLVTMRDGLDQNIDPGSARRREHLRGHRGRQGGRAHPEHARRGPRRVGVQTPSSARRFPARCSPSSCTTSGTNGSGSSGPSPSGTSRNTSTSCRERPRPRPTLGTRSWCSSTWPSRIPARSGDLLTACGPATHVVELDEGRAHPVARRVRSHARHGGPMDVWQEDRVPVAGRGEDSHPPLGARPRTSVSRVCVSGTSFWPTPWAGPSA